MKTNNTTTRRSRKSSSAPSEAEVLRVPERTNPIPIVLGLLLVAAGVFVLFWVRVLDPDVLMHIRTGQWIIEHRAIPRADIFSASAAGHPWTTHEWLWEALAYILYRAASWKALYALRLLLVAGTLVCAGFAAKRIGATSVSAIAACLLALGPLASFAEIRPQLASYLLFAAALLLLFAAEQRPKLLLILPAIFLLWTNLHGAVLLGFVLLGCAVAVAVIRKQAHLRWLIGVSMACLVAALINPHGYEVFTFPLKVVGQQSFRQQIYEWSRPELSRAFAPFWVFAAVSVVLVGLYARRIPLLAIVLYSIFFAAAIASRRQIPFFGIAAIPAVSLALSYILKHLRLPSNARTLAPVALLVVCALMLPLSFQCYAAAGRIIGLGLAPNRFPEIATNRLAHLQVHGAVLNDYNDGGYLIWRLHPNWPVIMDGRVDVYGPEIVKQYESVWSGAPEWKNTVRMWNVEAIVGRYEVSRAMPKHNLYHELMHDPEWALVYWDDVSQLFLHRGTSLEASGIRPYRIVAPGLSLNEMAKGVRSADEWRMLGADLRRAVSEVPESGRAASLLQQYEKTKVEQ